MASLLTNLVLIFTGANWLAWYPQMESFLMAQGLYYVITDECPSPTEDNYNTSNISNWNHHNIQSIGNLHLCLAPNILAKSFPRPQLLASGTPLKISMVNLVLLRSTWNSKQCWTLPSHRMNTQLLHLAR
ncbi:hypothetical protein BS17DRAFT_765756 [Gyrodon lividus]|nr:hypothetical protein BS17DRAFT_765756 [Gyrodon lividus]